MPASVHHLWPEDPCGDEERREPCVHGRGVLMKRRVCCLTVRAVGHDTEAGKSLREVLDLLRELGKASSRK